MKPPIRRVLAVALGVAVCFALDRYAHRLLPSTFFWDLPDMGNFNLKRPLAMLARLVAAGLIVFTSIMAPVFVVSRRLAPARRGQPLPCQSGGKLWRDRRHNGMPSPAVSIVLLPAAGLYAQRAARLAEAPKDAR